MDEKKVVAKFGDRYIADQRTFKMGIDRRLADRLAERFAHRVVLETCSGGGFSTIALARRARHVFSVDIDGSRLEDARRNTAIAGVEDRVTFIHSDIFQVDPGLLGHRIESAYLDPDWAQAGEDHPYRFLDSNTQPPSDKLLKFVLEITPNLTLIQAPYIDPVEFADLPEHELERLMLEGEHALWALHFGSNMRR